MGITAGYTIDHPKAVAGQVVDGQLNNSVSRINKGANVLAFGLFYQRDGDDGIKLTDSSTTTADLVGVLRYELNHAQATTVGLPTNRTGSVLTDGVIYVEKITATTQGADVYVVVGDSGTVADAGKVANVTGTSTATAIKLEGARFAETTSAGAGLVAVSITIGG